MGYLLPLVKIRWLGSRLRTVLAFCSWSVYFTGVWTERRPGVVCASVFQVGVGRGGTCARADMSTSHFHVCLLFSKKGLALNAHTVLRMYTFSLRDQLFVRRCVSFIRIAQQCPCPIYSGAYTKLWHAFQSFCRKLSCTMLITLAMDWNQPIAVAQNKMHDSKLCKLLKL